MIRLFETIADSTGFELARHMFSLKHLTTGQRIDQVDNYMPSEVVALVEFKEAEMLSSKRKNKAKNNRYEGDEI